MSKLMETNELMMAIQRMLVDNLKASITGYGQRTEDNYEADFQAIIDNKEYTITIEQLEADDV